MINNINLLDIITTSILAGEKIIEVYQSDFAVENKEDNSPLTLADKKSHQTIVENLAQNHPDIPVISEEGASIPYGERRDWDYYWLIDPLDGTKEFVKRNGEFTVNIALIHKGYPVLGVIYAPVLDIVYFAKKGTGSFKISDTTGISQMDEVAVIAKAEKLPTIKNEVVSIIGSRSHMSNETKEYIEEVKARYGEVEFTSAGSSLKLCYVAEGKADVYPRFAPTMEWDTAAGQAIVEQSGGLVQEAETGKRVRYNKENLLNPFFIAEKIGFELYG